MGIRDESWCNGCGASVPYSDAEENYCGDCGKTNGLSDILSYIKSLVDELNHEVYEKNMEFDSDDIDYIEGQVEILKHILAKFGAE